MVDSEYSTDNYKSSTISFGAVIQNPDCLKLKGCLNRKLKNCRS